MGGKTPFGDEIFCFSTEEAKCCATYPGNDTPVIHTVSRKLGIDSVTYKGIATSHCLRHCCGTTPYINGRVSCVKLALEFVGAANKLCSGTPTRAGVPVPFNGREAAFGLRSLALEPPRAYVIVMEKLGTAFG